MAEKNKFNHMLQIPVSGFVGMLIGSIAMALLYYVFDVWNPENLKPDTIAGQCGPFLTWAYSCAAGIFMHYIYAWISFRQQKNRQEYRDETGDDTLK